MCRPPAFVQIRAVTDIRKSRQYRIIEPCKDGEGKYLSLMYMPRELKVEKSDRTFVYQGPVLKKESKFFAREP